MFLQKIVKKFWWQILKVRIFGNFSTTFWPSTGQLSRIFEHNRDSPNPLPLGFPFRFSCFPPSSGGKNNLHFEIPIRYGNTLNEMPLNGLPRCRFTSNFIWFIKIIAIPRTVTAIQFESRTNRAFVTISVHWEKWPQRKSTLIPYVCVPIDQRLAPLEGDGVLTLSRLRCKEQRLEVCWIAEKSRTAF